MKTIRAFALSRFLPAALLLGSLRATEPAFHEPPLPAIPPRTFKITNFGAKGDGVTDSTKAVQAAINAASATGGGTVIVPGGNFLCGPIRLASHIDLRVEAGATLRMLPLDKYPGGTSDPANFISGSKLQDSPSAGLERLTGRGVTGGRLLKQRTQSGRA